jgi:hypothetical protein
MGETGGVSGFLREVKESYRIIELVQPSPLFTYKKLQAPLV